MDTMNLGNDFLRNTEFLRQKRARFLYMLSEFDTEEIRKDAITLTGNAAEDRETRLYLKYLQDKSEREMKSKSTIFAAEKVFDAKEQRNVSTFAEVNKVIVPTEMSTDSIEIKDAQVIEENDAQASSSHVCVTMRSSSLVYAPLAEDALLAPVLLAQDAQLAEDTRKFSENYDTVDEVNIQKVVKSEIIVPYNVREIDTKISQDLVLCSNLFQLILPLKGLNQPLSFHFSDDVLYRLLTGLFLSKVVNIEFLQNPSAFWDTSVPAIEFPSTVTSFMPPLQRGETTSLTSSASIQRRSEKIAAGKRILQQYLLRTPRDFRSSPPSNNNAPFSNRLSSRGG